MGTWQVAYAVIVYPRETMIFCECGAVHRSVSMTKYFTLSFILSDCNLFRSGQTGRSDENLSKGWYAFVSGAGGEIPTTPPVTGACSSIKPMWLNGKIIYP